MKTDDLIRALAADCATRPMPVRRLFVFALIPGIAIALIFHFTILGLRPHLLALLGDPRLLFKLCVTLLLAVLSGLMVSRIARPGAGVRRVALLLAMVPVLLAAANIAELRAVPAALWGQRLIGSNAVACLISIPFLAAAPLVAALFALPTAHRSIPPLPGRRRDSSLAPLARPVTRRIVRMIRRSSSRPGIRWRLASSLPPVP